MSWHATLFEQNMLAVLCGGCVHDCDCRSFLVQLQSLLLGHAQQPDERMLVQDACLISYMVEYSEIFTHACMQACCCAAAMFA